ncbi:MAG: hypothetical protein U9N04_01030 [Patescibacteria group bacterium]|nr:hypothetical protein [Patescibacteria group bacterium]
MRIKKTAIAMMIFSAIAMVVGVKFAGAQVYVPLVQIPGLPPGAVNLSMYLVGLYDFLLSIVGIVAVMMLIIGGMRYITAAGNQAAISDAKDIITNALAGLLLAILSWVIVAEINPDVLYIKKPGAGFSSRNWTDWGACGIYDIGTATCTCKDLFVLPGPTDQTECDIECRLQNRCLIGETRCYNNQDINGPSFYSSSDDEVSGQDGECYCIDGMHVAPVGGADCQTTCLAANCTKIGFKIGRASVADAFHMNNDKIRAQTFAIDGGEMWDHATETIESCNLYINAADYTTRFDDVVYMKIDRGNPSFDGDCFNVAKPLLDLLAQPFPGYYGPQPPNSTWLGCFLDDITADYTIWQADVALGFCKQINDPPSVTCPIRMCVEYSDGTRKETIRYLRMLEP